MKYIPALVICLFLFFKASGQEELTGLMHNPVVKYELSKMSIDGVSRSELDEDITIALPFFDDFHQESVFPDQGRWSTRDTYINADFPFRSANVGAATFDAIDATGNLYPEASVFPFIADFLVSNFIRLDSVFTPAPRALTVADSLYLSFYYQPQGRGNAPERWDSLVLQFGVFTGDTMFGGYYDSIRVAMSDYISPGELILPFDTIFAPLTCDSGLYIIAIDTLTYQDSVTMPCDSAFIPVTKWYTVWSSNGMKLDTFYLEYNTYSRQVMIPITDSARFFNKSFRFRFFNYASLSSNNVPSWRSNTDQWNVDYVYLNINRTASDTSFRKITFAERAPSMLKRYESMPYNQYKNDPTNEMADSALLYITNLDDEAYNTDYWYRIEEVEGTYSHFYDGGGCNLPPFYEFGFQRCDETCGSAHACPPVNFIFPLGFGKDSASFLVEHRINGFTAADTIGDTLLFQQKFYNYFAYDDGTPEAGYGVNSLFGRVAYRFRLNVSDTLRAVRMYFNRTEGNANDQLFNLLVFRDNDGEPGEIIYAQENLRPQFTDDLYKLSTYYLDEAVPVSGVFYIGWLQTTADNLNLGWDNFNDASNNIYYNVSGQWQKTAYKGSMIMRPVLGEAFDPHGVPEHANEGYELLAYPNPIRGDQLNIRISGARNPGSSSKATLTIYNLFGQQLRSQPFSGEIDVSGLPNGMYLLRYADTDQGILISTRFVVSRR